SIRSWNPLRAYNSRADLSPLQSCWPVLPSLLVNGSNSVDAAICNRPSRYERASLRLPLSLREPLCFGFFLQSDCRRNRIDRALGKRQNHGSQSNCWTAQTTRGPDRAGRAYFVRLSTSRRRSSPSPQHRLRLSGLSALSSSHG